MEKNNKKISFPSTVLAPLVRFLREQQKKLRNSKNALKKEDPFVIGKRDLDNSVDSDVAENVEHDRTSALRRQVTRSIIAVKKTLTRIKLGKYGICIECGKMIDTDRLAIAPTADLCISCEIKKESKKR